MRGADAEGGRVLVLGEEDAATRDVVRSLSRAGYQATRATHHHEAERMLRSRHHDAAILDAAPNGAADLLRSLRRVARNIPVLLLVEPTHVREAVKLLRQGADDYLLRPPDPFELKARLGRLLERYELDSRVALLQDELSRSRHGATQPVGTSAAMRQVLERLARVAPMRTTVLITGESGAGKELIARAIHYGSLRRDHPFVALNCAAIPPTLIESELFGHERGSFTGAHATTRGKFELAHRGTLFLDEIGEMNPGTQAKLLRILEEKEFMRVGGDRSLRVDVRVLAATNADLEDRVAAGQFRRDLYYRLKVVTIRVPPLRERRSDIPVLVETFLDELARANAVTRKHVTPESLDALVSYDWPGNVRELKNVLESVLVAVPGDTIRAEDLPANIAGASSSGPGHDIAPGTTLAEMERELIRRTLEYTGGNRTHSADMLGIGVRTLQRKIRSYGIRIPPRRRRPRRRTASEEAAR